MGERARPPEAADAGDLAVVCGAGGAGPAPRGLVAELRAAGYLEPHDDLGRLLEDRGSHRLRVALPDELCERLLDAYAGGLRFSPKDGYLHLTTSSAAPLSASDAFRHYGMALLAEAAGDPRRRAEIPGQGGRRLLAGFLHRFGFLFAPVLGPLAIVMTFWQAAANFARRGDWPTEWVARRLAVYEVRATLVAAALPAVVYAAVCWVWLALPLPPGGTVVRPVVALLAAGTVALLVFIPWASLVALSGWGLPERIRERADKRAAALAPTGARDDSRDGRAP